MESYPLPLNVVLTDLAVGAGAQSPSPCVWLSKRAPLLCTPSPRCAPSQPTAYRPLVCKLLGLAGAPLAGQTGVQQRCQGTSRRRCVTSGVLNITFPLFQGTGRSKGLKQETVHCSVELFLFFISSHFALNPGALGQRAPLH